MNPVPSTPSKRIRPDAAFLDQIASAMLKRILVNNENRQALLRKEFAPITSFMANAKTIYPQVSFDPVLHVKVINDDVVYTWPSFFTAPTGKVECLKDRNSGWFNLETVYCSDHTPTVLVRITKERIADLIEPLITLIKDAIRND